LWSSLPRVLGNRWDFGDTVTTSTLGFSGIHDQWSADELLALASTAPRPAPVA
jgi:hypothetical protein